MEFLLDSDVIFLNHGSFGACPRPVHEEYQRIQRQLESQPVRFLQRELPTLLTKARHTLAQFIGAADDEVVFVANPTYAVNEIARSLRLGAGDEILVSNHEYGACRNTWQFMAERNGFSVIEARIALPVESGESMTEGIWAAVTENTKVIFLSHITSPTALTIPVAEVCARARNQGIITVIDGAHAPGQIDLNLAELGADFYLGTCHKWLCAPKGSAFFYARTDMQHLIEPLVVGWGWGAHRQFDSGSNFLDFHEWLGTADTSAFLTVPTAIDFQQENRWPRVQGRCHELAASTIDRATELPAVDRVHQNEHFVQMGLLEIGRNSEQIVDPRTLQGRLYDEFRVEVPIISWRDPSGIDRVFARFSVQAYNTEADLDTFVRALGQLLSGTQAKATPS